MSRRGVTTLLVIAVAGVSGCGGDNGESGGGTGAGGGSGDGGCLTAEQVQQRIDEIAGGFESSAEEVEAKQREIQAIRAREC